MKKLWVLTLSLFVFGLTAASAQEQTQTQQEGTSQQRLVEGQDYALVRFAHLSPNAPEVNITLLPDDGTVDTQTAPATTDTAAAPATTEQQAQQAMGMLEVVVEPNDAIISLTGPDGYQDSFQGSHLFSNLVAGSYAVSATRQGFESATEEVNVAEGETVSVNLTLPESEGDEGAQLRQQEQLLTAEQQQQMEAQLAAAQQPATTDPTVTTTQDPAVAQDPAITTDPAMTAGPMMVQTPQAVGYEQVSDYLPVVAGNYVVQITTDEGALAYEGRVDFGAGRYYTVAALGFVLEGQEGSVQPVVEENQAGGFFDWLGGLFGDDQARQDELTIRVFSFNDEPGNFPEAGNAHIRVIHASAGSPEVDLVLVRGAAQGQAAVGQQPATAAQQTQQAAQQEGAGMLEVVVDPADAIVSLVGPDGYDSEFSGSQTISNLVPGNYVVSATRQGFEAAGQEVAVGEGETASVSLTLDESEGDEAAQLRGQDQPVTEAQQAAAQQPATTDPAVTTTQDPAVVQDPAGTQDPAVTEDLDVIAGSLAYGEASNYQAFRAAEGSNLQIRLAGTETANVLLDLGDAEFEHGHVYTVFVVGTTFEDYAINYVKLIDSRLGGGSEDNGMTTQDQAQEETTTEETTTEETTDETTDEGDALEDEEESDD